MKNGEKRVFKTKMANEVHKSEGREKEQFSIKHKKKSEFHHE